MFGTDALDGSRLRYLPKWLPAVCAETDVCLHKSTVHFESHLKKKKKAEGRPGSVVAAPPVQEAVATPPWHGLQTLTRDLRDVGLIFIFTKCFFRK